MSPRPEAGTEQAAGCGSREDTSVPQAVARVWGMLSGAVRASAGSPACRHVCLIRPTALE